MKVAIASDHAGFLYKEQIIPWLKQHGHEVIDFGTDSTESTDYPIFVRPAAEALGRGEVDRAIVLGGSGNGEAIAANRIKGVRCALCWNVESAIMARKHNDANAISLGERMLAFDLVEQILEAFFVEEFEGGRHVRRINMLDAP